MLKFKEWSKSARDLMIKSKKDLNVIYTPLKYKCNKYKIISHFLLSFDLNLSFKNHTDLDTYRGLLRSSSYVNAIHPPFQV
jgi:hypothetical protein